MSSLMQIARRATKSNGMITIADHVEITVRRPDGSVETVTHPTLHSMTDAFFAALVAGTRAAGRGDVLSYRNVTREIAGVQPSSSERMERAMAYGESDECSTHGSQSEAAYPSDAD